MCGRWERIEVARYNIYFRKAHKNILTTKYTLVGSTVKICKINEWNEARKKKE